jgi:hypothetical protein
MLSKLGRREKLIWTSVESLVLTSGIMCCSRANQACGIAHDVDTNT